MGKMSDIYIRNFSSVALELQGSNHFPLEGANVEPWVSKHFPLEGASVETSFKKPD